MTSIRGSSRRVRGLMDIVPQHDDTPSDKISNASTDSDHRSTLSGIKIQHLTNSCGFGHPRFPKLEECAHFHYEHVELNSLQLSLYEEDDLKSISSLESNENSENKWLTVKVVSQGQCWLLKRTYENFRMLDQQLHQCIYDRKFSLLSELPPLENLSEKHDSQIYIKCQLSKYCERFSDIAGNLINCGPVLNWLQLDNRGRRILVTDGDNCPINTPAVAAAYAIKKYIAIAADEISFDVGDMISVIDMPPPEDSIWWRGKRGFMVGFFPSYSVAVITDKVPRNLQLNQPSNIIEPSKPVLRKHGKLIAFFRAFILSRPSKRHLKQSGILKERVFGCDLGEHLLNSGREVPTVLKCCSEFIEKHGIVDGIYRLSGATSNIQKLRTTFDEDRIPGLYNDDSILQDIHSVASLLKMYFRELPNPLCTYQLYKHFVRAVQNVDPTERVASMRDVVKKLPPPHFRTLEFLMRHLSRVAEHGGRTGMTARNIAIVWAPNLLRCKELEFGGVAALQGVGVQAVVTEFLISNVELVFCNDNVSFQTRAGRIRPKSLSLGTPTKLLSLEEAQNKKFGVELSQDNNYIEVGEGPKCLPKVYHTVIELPSRKRTQLKRSPLGWKSLFSRINSGSVKSASNNSGKRKTLTSNELSYKYSEPVSRSESDVKNRLRSVKSVDSLVSGVVNSGTSARNSVCLEYPSPPSPKLTNTSGHSRSVSHDSYFDHLTENTKHSAVRHDEEGLSDLQVNFDLDESEMKIFSENSSQLFSNNSSSEHLQTLVNKKPVLASAENTIIVDPSPKKHKNSDSCSCSSTSFSDDMTAVSNKRSRLEEKFNEDFTYIDSQCDRLVVEVDIHRVPSQISSPLADNAGVSSCTMSESTITNNIAYTPLSEFSCTTSSNYDPSYHPLSSSVSSSQLPRSSTESMKLYDSKKYENVPRNRFSYHGDLRLVVPNIKNRLSLQTLDLNATELPSRCPEKRSPNVDIYKCDSNDKSQDKYDRSILHCKMKPKENEANLKVAVDDDRLLWRGDDIAHSGSVSSKESNEDLQKSEYEDVQKLELVLNDKEMFSDENKTASLVSESPYELVTIVGRRMTSVLDDISFFTIKSHAAVEQCNYEEVRPESPNARQSFHSDGYGNYEEMSSLYTNNEIYNCEGGALTSEERSNYEEISVLRDGLSSSNESLQSSDEEAMIENNLYESLIDEHSSPDSRLHRPYKEVDEMRSSDQCENVLQYKDIVITSLSNINKTGESLVISSISDAYPGCNNSEQPAFENSSAGDAESDEPSLVASFGGSTSDHQNHESMNPVEHSIGSARLCSHKEVGSVNNCDNECDNKNRVETNADFIVEKCNTEKENESIRPDYVNSVQDLVSKFEWCSDADVSKCSVALQRSKTTSQLPSDYEKKEYFSLPPVLVKKKSYEDTLPQVIEKVDGTSVRRDRIEKYKEERRQALRQKYQVEDGLSDQKDEEMIRRFKQKFLKSEKADLSNRSYSDSSPNNGGVIAGDYVLSKEDSDKPPPAVTTISILYTCRKRRECVANEGVPVSSEVEISVADLSETHSATRCNKEFAGSPRCVDESESAVMSKALAPSVESSRDWCSKYGHSSDGKRSLTSSLERKVKSFVREESLVAKRVIQLSEASELSEISSRIGGGNGSMRRRAHSTSGPVVPYCIRDIAAIFENRDNTK